MGDLTREAVLALPAGPELDALVASMLAGIPIQRTTIPYSTDMGAAWRVVLHFTASWYASLESGDGPRGSVVWVACFSGERGTARVVQCEASSAPLAICRAAILSTLDEEARRG